MRFYDNALLHAASDLNAFLGCAHAAALNLQKLRDPQSLPDKADDDESMVLVQDAGHAHEAAYLAGLTASGNVTEINSKGDLGARARATDSGAACHGDFQSSQCRNAAGVRRVPLIQNWRVTMAVVYVEARPKGKTEDSPITDYVVEDHADHVLATFQTQSDAIVWAIKNGHTPHVARVRHLNDKKKPDHWRAA